MRCFVRAPGVLMAPVGDGWAAFSSLSGETHVLNEESVAIVDLLDCAQPRSSIELSRALADECGVPVPEIESTLAAAWGTLIEAGLVREQFSVVPTER